MASIHQHWIGICNYESFFAFPDYEIVIPKRVQEKLKIEEEKDVAIYP